MVTRMRYLSGWAESFRVGHISPGSGQLGRSWDVSSGEMDSELVFQTCAGSLWKEDAGRWLVNWSLLPVVGYCPPDLDTGPPLGFWFLAESCDCFPTCQGLLLERASVLTLQGSPCGSLGGWLPDGEFEPSGASLGMCARESQEPDGSFCPLPPTSPQPQSQSHPGTVSSFSPC